MYKSGANFADRNRIKKMIEEGKPESGDPWTVDEIAALLQIKPEAVASWVDHFMGVTPEADPDPDPVTYSEEEEEEDGSDW